MADFEEADQQLMDWLAERTDTQLQRLLDAPEEGLTNDNYVGDDGCKCLVGWAWGLHKNVDALSLDVETRDGGTAVLCDYGLYGCSHADDDGTIMRRIQRFAAAELLTRRVECKALPAPTRESVPA